MKLKVYFGKGKLILLIIVMILALSAIIINSLFLAGVGKLVTNVPVAASISLAFSVIIILFALSIIFLSNYNFGESIMISSISFFQDKVYYDLITDIKEESVTKELYLVFKYNTDKEEGKINSLRLLVKPQENEKIVKFLLEKNPEIIYESFANPTKNIK